MATEELTAAEVEDTRGYGRGARILSIGIASTGVLTFAYFSVAGHVLGKADYGAVTTLWTVLFITISVIYRPVEQLLSRTIADRIARGQTSGHPLGQAALIQAGFAAAFLVLALVFKGRLTTLFNDSSTLYWILVASTLAYAASYFARGYLAGHQWFALYGGLVLFESTSRFCFPVAVAVGIADGRTAVALGILAAPFVSLLVVPFALARHTALADPVPSEIPATARSAGFAASVSAVQLSEQTLLNVGVLFASGTALRGVIFSAFLVARAPLQLFQAVQTSLLPHLATLEATDGQEGFDKAIRTTVLVIGAFAGLVAAGLLAIGPFVMDVVFDHKHHYPRAGLVVLALGMGAHLIAGTLNQAALARGAAAQAAQAWVTCALAFVAWMAIAVVHDGLLRAQVGYLGAALVLGTWLYAIDRRRLR